MATDDNNTHLINNLTETLEDLNKRYADALVPMAVWLGLLSVLGIFGNILVIVVFSVSPEYKRTNFKVFVISLAVVDLLTCVSLMPAEIAKTRQYFSYLNGTHCKVKCFFNLFGQNASAFVLLIICVDRYRKVCKPLKEQIWPGLATKLIVAIMLLSCLLSVPAPILCGISSANKTNVRGTNTTVFFCAAEEKYHNSILRYVYKIGLTVSLLIVAVSFIVMYTLILKTIIQHWRNVDAGGSVRFESTRSLARSEKIEADVFESPCRQELRTMAMGPTNVKLPRPGCNEFNSALVKSNNIWGHKCSNGRCPSRGSQSSESSKSRQSLVKTTASRTGSDWSLRAYSIRRMSSSRTYHKIPYKTLIWLILTLVFIITYFVNALLSFITTRLDELSPLNLLAYVFFFRIYFINNVINPIIYTCLDKRFNKSCCHFVNLVKRKFRLCLR